MFVVKGLVKSKSIEMISYVIIENGDELFSEMIRIWSKNIKLM